MMHRAAEEESKDKSREKQILFNENSWGESRVASQTAPILFSFYKENILHGGAHVIE
jgi:hypothetical protein